MIEDVKKSFEAGAAMIAMRLYRAKYGIGEGITGNSYGIPTKDKNFNVRSLDEIKESVDRFIAFAVGKPELNFFVTGIGCGYAGYTATEIAPFFKEAPDNVSVPDIFYNVIHSSCE